MKGTYVYEFGIPNGLFRIKIYLESKKVHLGFQIVKCRAL